MRKIKIYSWLTMFCVLLPSLVISQEWGLDIDGSVSSDNDRSKINGAKVIIYRNGSKSDTKTTDAKGRFMVTLAPDAKYKLEFVYAGYVSKHITFNTKFVPPEAAEQAVGDNFIFRFDISLFKEVEGLDVSILNKPVAEVVFDPNAADFNYDKEYSKTIKIQVEKLKADLAALEKQYASEMANAAKAESRGDMIQAIGFYEAALAVKPDDATASSKKEAAQKKYDKEKAGKEKEKAYETAIENAELALYDKKYKEAEAEFQKALDAKPGDTYARDQLREIKALMVAEAKSEQIYFEAISKGDAAMAENDYLTAKSNYLKAKEAKPDEEYPKIQLEQVEALLVADAQKESQYIKAIERGESSMESKDYEAAKAAFEQASEVKPAENYPKDQIAKIATILAGIELANKSYNDAIKRADDALTKNEFENAKKGYEEALGLKPDEQYPKDQIAAIVSKMEEFAAIEKEYNELIKDADQRFDTRDLIAAKAEYTKALELKPGEEHPNSRIAEISGILEAEAKLDEDYKHAIENADNAYGGKDYKSAKFEYQSASDLKPNEAYPKEQMLKIDELLAELAQQDEAYDNAVKAGDEAFAAANFEVAKTSYIEASSIKVDEQYPKDQLEKVEEKMIELANLDKDYDEAIASADQLLEEAKLAEAKTEYEKALEFKPSESYPKEKIATIVGLIAAAQKNDADYQKYITEGNAAMSSKEYSSAQTAFNAAAGVKPEESYPAEKLAEIEKILSDMEAQKAEYKAAIAKADEAFNNNDLEASLPLYKEAAGIKEDEAYPVQQITLIEAKLEDLKKLDESYAAAINKAENEEKENEFAAALTSYKDASSLKPDEELPKEKIAALTILIAEMEKNDAAYNDAVSLGDEAIKAGEFDIAITQFKNAQNLKPEESYPKEKIEEAENLKANALAAIELANKQQAEYDQLISEADDLLGKSEFAASKEKYVASLEIKPEETYPKTKIGEIEGLMADEAERKARDEKYTALIATADASFKSNDYDASRGAYMEAQTVKPEETYPGDQLKAIEAALVAAAALASQAEKEAAEKARNEKYASLISSGDGAFNSQDWDAARSAYNEAKGVKPEETYPGEQLKAIEAAIVAAAALASQAEKEAAEKARNEKYAALISTADGAFNSEDWDGARSAYNEAQGVKPEETYPSDQLKAIEVAVAAAAALASQAEKEAAEKARNEKYAALISTADGAFNSEDWDGARSAYNEAQGVKPEETYPADQLKAIEAAIVASAALASQAEKEAAEKARNEKYNSLIFTADGAFSSEDWEGARAAYNEAQGLKPEESYPGDQLKAIDAAIAAAAALASQQERESAQRELEEKYNNLIASADRAFNSKDWPNARSSYSEALIVKPGESYPSEQLKAIELQVASAGEEAKREQYQAYITSADRAFKSKDWSSAKSNYESALSVLPSEAYPKDQLARIAEAIEKEGAIALQSELDEEYRQIIGDADQLFAVSDWNASRSKYEEALTVKPGEKYPTSQIALIADRINKASTENEAVQARYDKIIADADRSFNTEDYKNAKISYKQALDVKSDESYPKNRIAEIDDILKDKDAELAALALLNKNRAEYDRIISRADNAFSSKDYSNARKNYQSALSVIPGETYPSNKISEIDALLAQQSTSPAATPSRQSSGMTDAEIAAMMLAWQTERDQAKADQLNQYQKELKETSDDRVASSEERRLETNDELDDLENDIRESNKAGENRNLDEALLIAEFKEDQKDYTEDLTQESKEKREGVYEEIEETEMGQKEIKEKGNELYLVNTEKKTTEKIELQNQNQENRKAENKELMATHDGIVELEDGIRKDKERGMDHYMSEVERIEKDNEQVRSTLTAWTSTSGDNRADAYKEIVQLEDDLRDFKENNSESYMNNTRDYWDNVSEYTSYASKKEGESLNRRNKAYNDITDYSADVSEVTQEKNNNYLENSAEILKKNQAITDRDAQLSADAAERRLDFNRDFYTGEKKPRNPDIARQYPQGVTEESFEEDDAYVVKRIVVEGESINEYKKIYYKWGGVYYKKNGQSTTEVIWNNETE